MAIMQMTTNKFHISEGGQGGEDTKAGEALNVLDWVAIYKSAKL